jgi:hypothetical protein
MTNKPDEVTNNDLGAFYPGVRALARSEKRENGSVSSSWNHSNSCNGIPIKGGGVPGFPDEDGLGSKYIKAQKAENLKGPNPYDGIPIKGGGVSGLQDNEGVRFDEG